MIQLVTIKKLINKMFKVMLINYLNILTKCQKIIKPKFYCIHLAEILHLEKQKFFIKI